MIFFVCSAGTLIYETLIIKRKYTSVFGGEMQNWMRPILAFSTLLGPFTLQDFWVKTKPSINSVSSTVPPNFLITLMSFKLTALSFPGSVTFKTAYTAIGANKLEYWETTWKMIAWNYLHLFKGTLILHWFYLSFFKTHAEFNNKQICKIDFWLRFFWPSIFLFSKAVSKTSWIQVFCLYYCW